MMDSLAKFAMSAALLLASSVGAQTVTSFPYFEDFESDDGGFAAGGDDPSWAWGVPTDARIPMAASGTSCWVTNLSGIPNFAEDSWIDSPEFDCTSMAVDPVLAFRRIADVRTGSGSARVQVSIDGSAFESLTDESDLARLNWYEYPGLDRWVERTTPRKDWKLARHTLVGAAGHSVRLRFWNYISPSSLPFGGMAIDDVQVFESRSDLEVLHKDSPARVGPLSVSVPLTVRVNNMGSAPIQGFDLTCVVSGPVPFSVTESFMTTLPAYSGADLQFTQPLDLSLLGEYTIDVSAVSSGDEIAANDFASTTTLRQAAVTAFPMFEDFEVDDGGFVSLGNTSTWERGAAPGYDLLSAASGTHVWVTNLAGPPDECEDSALYLPVMDLSSFVHDPLLAFEIYSSHEGLLSVQVSLDEGPFVTVGPDPDFGPDPIAENWYGSNPDGWSNDFLFGWRRASHILHGAAGHRAVVRFAYVAERMTLGRGIALDAFEIYEAPFDGGQPATTGVATLDVNECLEVIGYPVAYEFPGPYSAEVSVSDDLFELTIEGAPNQVIALYGGQSFVGAWSLPGIGQVDLSPAHLLASGSQTTGLGPLFVTNAVGRMQLFVGVPAALVGSTVTYQAVLSTPAPGLALSNSVSVTFTL